jgi:hypothetical protein
MIFRIHYDFRDAADDRYPEGVDPLVYLVSSVDAITERKLAWVATDGNSSMDPTRFTTELTDLGQLVDWPLMLEKYWKNTEDDGDRVRRRAAEFLVHEAVPIDALLGFAVRSSERATELAVVLKAHGYEQIYCSVRPDWYP